MKPTAGATHRWGFSLVLGAALFLAACGSEDEEAPPTLPPTDTGVDSGDVSVPDAPDTDVPETTVPDADQPDAQVDADDVAPDVSPDTTDVDPDAPQPVCDDPSGCWLCTPTTELQALNSCTDDSCAAFDNRTRLPGLLPDGSLPPLP